MSVKVKKFSDHRLLEALGFERENSPYLLLRESKNRSKWPVKKSWNIP